MVDVKYATETDLFPDAYTRRYEDVYLPVCKQTVCIRSLNAMEVDKWQMAEIAKDQRGIIRSRIEDRGRRLIAICLVDKPGGNLLLNPTHVRRMALLWDNADIALLEQACTRFCGVAQADADAEETAVKNSEKTSGDCAKSASPDATTA